MPRAARPLTLAAVLAVLAAAPAGTGAQTAAPTLAPLEGGSPTSLPATTLAHLRAVLAATMRHAGPRSGAYVVDLASGDEIYAAAPDSPRIPASVEKLYTTTTALARFGPDGTFATSVEGVGAPDAAGVWHGDLYLVGGGDPTFGSRAAAGGHASAADLAASLIASTSIARVTGAVIGDESIFDAQRGEPDSRYRPDPELAGELSGLAFDHGSSGKLGSPAAFAASQLAAALRARGVTVIGRSSAGAAPAGAQVLARVQSPPLATLVALTDLPSDNFYAETLLKDLGARFGGAGSTAAGAKVVLAWLAKRGIAPQIVDGSGLSPDDRTTPRQVVALLRDLRPTGPLAALGGPLLAALPVAGRSGTLIHRMRGTRAAGQCMAKTGTLTGVSTLAGICDGRFAFAFLMNAIADTKARALQDTMTIALAASGYFHQPATVRASGQLNY